MKEEQEGAGFPFAMLIVLAIDVAACVLFGLVLLAAVLAGS